MTGLTIEPSLVTIKARASIKFLAVNDGLPIAALWSLSDPSLGSIASDGTFTSTGQLGTIEVYAETQGRKPWAPLTALRKSLAQLTVIPNPEGFVTFKDLLNGLTADQATDSTNAAAVTAAANVLASANTVKASSASVVSADVIAFSAAIAAAPGGQVIDDSATPFVAYTSTDGKTFTSSAVASINDPVPTPATPPAAAASPGS